MAVQLVKEYEDPAPVFSFLFLDVLLHPTFLQMGEWNRKTQEENIGGGGVTRVILNNSVMYFSCRKLK